MLVQNYKANEFLFVLYIAFYVVRCFGEKKNNYTLPVHTFRCSFTYSFFFLISVCQYSRVMRDGDSNRYETKANVPA